MSPVLKNFTHVVKVILIAAHLDNMVQNMVKMETKNKVQENFIELQVLPHPLHPVAKVSPVGASVLHDEDGQKFAKATLLVNKAMRESHHRLP